MKKINIPLPTMEGVELKSATVDIEKGIVVAEYGSEEKLARVPESIGIYKMKEIASSNYDKGDGLHISFNNDKQLLSTSDCVLHVQPNDEHMFKKVQCYLQPIKYEELKVGDTFFCDILLGFASPVKYYKKLKNTQCRIGANGLDVLCVNLNFDRPLRFYKLIPIQS